jgi:ribosomal protein L37AE/L43A
MTAGPTENQLHRCASCGRHVRRAAATGAHCEFCGGPLRAVWGLGQTPTLRAGDAAAPSAKLQARIREMLRGGPSPPRREGA